MAYDEGVAQRVREAVDGNPGVTEKKMFGGLAFLLGGNMAVGIVKHDLMVRVGPASYEECLRLPHARPMDFTGKPMRGLVYVAPAGHESDDGLREWVARGIAFAGSLPAK
jgi:TfoX/Sxy family transcriptional regulator of competence genes